MKLLIIFLLSFNCLAGSRKDIKKAQYKNWAFKESHYVLGCKNSGSRKLVYIETVGQRYETFALNGAAKSVGIWADSRSEQKYENVQTFIQEGLALCK